MTDLNDLFKVIAEGKKDYETNNPVGQKLKQVKESAKTDLSDLFSQLTSIKTNLEKELVILEAKHEEQVINEISTLVAEETLTEEIPQIIQPDDIPSPEERAASVQQDALKYLSGKSFQQPDPDLVSHDIDDVRAKIKFLEQAIGRIAATGPGGGEVNLRWLDDVDRSTISDGLFLRYNNTKKKFEFVDINSYTVTHHGSYYDSLTQELTDNQVNSGTPLPMYIRNVVSQNGIEVVDGYKLKVSKTAVYNLQFSAQLHNNGGGGPGLSVYIWLTENGIYTPESATKMSVYSNSPYNVAAWNFVIPITAGNWVSLMWYTDNAHIVMPHNTTVFNFPNIPSVIITLTEL